MDRKNRTYFDYIIIEENQNDGGMSMSLIQDMKKHKNLTERDQDIRQYILDQPEKIDEMSSRERGYATFTSAASVTRFCQKLGTKGFPEFKLQLVRELQY